MHLLNFETEKFMTHITNYCLASEKSFLFDHIEFTCML